MACKQNNYFQSEIATLKKKKKTKSVGNVQSAFSSIINYHKVFSSGAGAKTGVLREANLIRVCRNHRNLQIQEFSRSKGALLQNRNKELPNSPSFMPLVVKVIRQLSYSTFRDSPHIPRGTNMPKISNSDPELNRSHPRRSPE